MLSGSAAQLENMWRGTADMIVLECHEPQNAQISITSNSKAHLRTSEEPEVPKALFLRDSFPLRENLWLQRSPTL